MRKKLASLLVLCTLILSVISFNPVSDEENKVITKPQSIELYRAVDPGTLG